MLKQLIKRVVNKFGFDIKKFQPYSDTLGWVKHLNIMTVIDIGANTGQFATAIRQKLPSASIYSFEPIQSCYEKLKETMRGDAHFQAFNYALGDIDTTKEINVSSYSPSSSLLPMADLHKRTFPHTKETVKKETTAIKRLDAIFPALECPKNIMLKMDVQGYEDKVIKGAVNTLAHISAVLTETSFYPLYEGQMLFSEIYELMKNVGFRYAGCHARKKNSENGMLLFEDSIFIKD